MAKKTIEKEIESWLEDIPDEYQESFLELGEVDDESVNMTIGEEEYSFTINFPKVIMKKISIYFTKQNLIHYYVLIE